LTNALHCGANLYHAEHRAFACTVLSSERHSQPEATESQHRPNLRGVRSFLFYYMRGTLVLILLCVLYHMCNNYVYIVAMRP